MNRIAMLLLVGAALFAGACGGSDESSQTAASAPAPASETPTATPTPTDWPDAGAAPKKSEESGAAKSSSSGESAGGGTKTVDIKNFAFGPSNVTVKVGDKVTWTNDDDAPHTVTGGALDSGNLSKGGTFSFTADKAGTIQYICAIHPTMKGTLTVQ